MSNANHAAELRAEREYIAFLYRRLAGERTGATRELAGVLRNSSDADGEARWQREVAANAVGGRVNGLRVADHGLCFGRLDHAEGGHQHIGRIGLFDEEADYEPLLMDWRAPAARPFYCATAANPEGVTRRRHFHTRGQEVLDFHDDHLDGGGQGGDTALLAALNAPRGETMRDIVATIQSEQDEIIRLEHKGVVVIEGGPGTGKTAVALHRVAYLLYTRRERLSRSGVLIVGPNPGFLRYVGEVLPSLGETDVVFAAPGELFPGVTTTIRESSPETERVKGSAVMADVLAAALADRQRVPEEPIEIELDDVTVPLDAGIAGSARELARASGLPHNEARSVFRQALIAALTESAVRRIGTGWLTGADRLLRADLADDVRRELVASPELAAAVAELWPELTPYELLGGFLADRDRLAAADGLLSPAERDALYRPDGDAWTVSDVPLLDEAVELLGTDRSAERRAEAERRARAEYARGVFELLKLDREEVEDFELVAADVIDPEALGERAAERDQRDLAERAAADREWTYGHVVVDEAQELSAMDWRVLMRRCPSRSFTVVGDLAQRQSAAGPRDWGDILAGYVQDRWSYRRLTVNYRTPAEIMAVAAGVLAEVDPTLEVPESVRSNGIQPWASRIGPDDLAEAVRAARREFAEGEGTVAVIAPPGTALDGPVLTPQETKGLEFDAVLLVEPQRFDGPAELYVALTRATQRLGVLHTEPLPPVLAGRLETVRRQAEPGSSRSALLT
ncbi:UvrD-helicase domain-containing protein [Amycolatopsis anabasis]|uniref:UvrD-helicase domain-containing protein n=1 Tax=Amycolatopsis anabasis TaxID=1840409 RepID=UPI00131AE2DA|nr:UvrD-helicase domain-containing protein [Amycolatopsis anabasis]